MRVDTSAPDSVDDRFDKGWGSELGGGHVDRNVQLQGWMSKTPPNVIGTRSLERPPSDFVDEAALLGDSNCVDGLYGSTLGVVPS